MAADAVGITAIARPRGNAAGDIAAVMDRGVAGVQIPRVDTAEDARRAVAAVKFGAGDGHRGLAAGTRPDRWGMGGRMRDFVAEVTAHSLVCVQLESAAAIRNTAEILAVADIDVFFIGPSDLSQSMGFPGDPTAPPVAAAIGNTLAAIRAAGKVPGMPATDENLTAVLASGCRYVYTHLPRVLGAGARGFMSGKPDG